MVFLFTVVTSPFVVLFGPFNNVKRAVIGAILQSRHPHYITWLFSEDELQSILGTVGVVKSQDLFKFNAREDKSLNLEKIQSARYVGYILEIVVLNNHKYLHLTECHTQVLMNRTTALAADL